MSHALLLSTQNTTWIDVTRYRDKASRVLGSKEEKENEDENLILFGPSQKVVFVFKNNS